VPIVIVQHMPDMFTRLLAERLTCLSAIPVEEGAAGTVLRPGRAYLAPGSHHMTVEANSGPAVIGIHHGPPESSCRPAVDVLFRSVAAVYKSRALALILTGMGRDGLEGCRSIRAAGGEILVQDEASSVVWGMPGAVARAQLANGVHPLDELPAQIVRRLARSALGTRP
jgi:two-component system chemotaxis response regulator CheB